MTQPTVLAAAQAIRPHLSSLLDPDTAERIDRELYYLLAQAEDGRNVENQITELLRQLVDVGGSPPTVCQRFNAFP
jgi:hypothetical protein